MNYDESLLYIKESYEKKGVKHPLEDLKSILKKMGSPEDKIKIIHVAGTNGKGSSCAMLTSILIEAGFKVGTFTSPHLRRYNERIRINNSEIEDYDFARHASIIKNAEENLSFFEILTLMAYNYFYEQNVDYAVIEVGLGGKHCPTNIVIPVLSVITKIGYDHMNYLGNTLESIASEKACIIKKTSDAVLYLNEGIVYNVVKEAAREQNAGFYYLSEYDCEIKKRGTDETIFSVSSKFFEYKNIRLKMLGDYQVYNACNLMLAVHVLKNIGLPITDAHVYDGLIKARWPGRMEIIRENPLILLDGAHNADGADEFNKTLGNYFPGKRIIVVTGMLRDKEYSKILRAVAERASHVILTMPDTKRALDPAELADVLDDTKIKTETQPDYKKALDMAVSLSGADDMVCVTGSLYLVADARNYLIEKGTVKIK